MVIRGPPLNFLFSSEQKFLLLITFSPCNPFFLSEHLFRWKNSQLLFLVIVQKPLLTPLLIVSPYGRWNWTELPGIDGAKINLWLLPTNGWKPLKPSWACPMPLVIKCPALARAAWNASCPFSALLGLCSLGYQLSFHYFFLSWV